MNKGYIGREFMPNSWNESKSADNCECKKIIISHSFGIHLINDDLLEKATDIVLINSFSNFIPKNKSRKVTRVLNLMKSGFRGNNTKNILKDFYKKCLYPIMDYSEFYKPCFENLSDNQLLLLKNDLEKLSNTRTLPSSFPKSSNVLVVRSENDNIVSNEANEDLKSYLNTYLDHKPIFISNKKDGHFVFSDEIIDKIILWF